METEHGRVETPPKKPRSDKGKPRKNPSAGSALSSVLIAIQDLSAADAKRVLMSAALFSGIRFIESTEGANGKRD